MTGTQSLQAYLPPQWRDWQITQELGSGSFGTVYRVEKISGSIRAVSAVKVISVPPDESQLKELAREFQSTAAMADYLKDLVQNYENEIGTMYNLQGDSNIVSIQDHLVQREADGLHWKIFIRMELLTSFSDYLLTRRLSEADIIRLGMDMCNALIKCEQLHIIHRDIKPDNIFVSKSGAFKLGDFGIARHLDRSFGNYSTKGTMNYMAPEVYKGEPYGSNVDLYSLGMILYKLSNRNFEPYLDTTMRMVYYKDKQAAFEQRMNGAPMNPPVDASPAFSRIIMKACSFDPKARYQSAAQLRQDLTALLSSGAYAGAARQGTGGTGRKGQIAAPGAGRNRNVTGSGTGSQYRSGQQAGGSYGGSSSGSMNRSQAAYRKSSNAASSGSMQGSGSASRNDPPKSGKKKTGLIVLLLAVLAGGGVLTGALLFRANKAKTEDPAAAARTAVTETEKKQETEKPTEKTTEKASETEQQKQTEEQRETAEAQTEALPQVETQAEKETQEQTQTETLAQTDTQPQTDLPSAAQETTENTDEQNPDVENASWDGVLYQSAASAVTDETFENLQDADLLAQADTLAAALGANRQGKNVLFAGALDGADEEELDAAKAYIAAFKADEASGQMGYAQYSAQERLMQIAALTEDHALVNVVLFDADAFAQAGTGKPSAFTRSVDLCLAKEEDGWKVDATREGRAWAEGIRSGSAMLPSALAAQIGKQGPGQVTYQEFYEGNALYVNRRRAYAGIKEYSPKYLWVNENGDLCVSFLFFNGSAQNVTYTGISGSIRDTDGNLIVSCEADLSRHPVSVPAGENRMVTVTFPKNGQEVPAWNLDAVTEETLFF